MAKELLRKSTVGTQHTVTNGAPNYERYEYLEKVFYKNEFYRIFSRPIILGRDDYGRPSEIRWMTDYNFIGEPVSLLSLPPGEQELVRGKVKYMIDQLYKDANRYMQADPVYKDLSHILDNCIEIPNDGCIYVLKVPDETGKFVDKYVLTQWGFINDDRKSSTGIVKRWTGQRTQHVRIKVSYPDGSPAIGENLYLEYGAVKKDLYTDERGIISLDDFPVNVSVHAYQLVGDVKDNVNNINTDERQDYSMTIKKQVRKNDLTILFVDHLGKVLPGIPVNISYPAFNQTITTGADGKTLLPDISENTGIDVSVAKGPQNSAAQYTIRFHPDRTTETIQLPAPPEPVLEDPPKDPPKEIPKDIPEPLKTGPTTLLFIDKKGVGAPNLPVEMVYNGKKYLLRTDAAGKIGLKDIPYNRTIDIRAKTGNSSYKGTIVHTMNKEIHTLQLKTNSLLWLWILLGLLALFLLYKYFGHRPVVSNAFKITVLDSTKKPIQYASITLKGLKTQSGMTDSTGVSLFPGLTAKDTFQVSVSDNGYIPMSFSGEGEEDTTVILYNLTRIPLDTLPKYPPVYGTITVHVTDSFSGSNLADANVHVDYQGLTTTTDGFGMARFTNIPTGTRTNCLVTLPDFEPATYSIICCCQNNIALIPKMKHIGIDSMTSNEKGITSTFVWDIGDHPSEFTVIYNMDSIPDEMEIFCGRDTTGTKIFWTPNTHSAPGPVSYADTITVRNTCGGNYVTVRMTGNNSFDPKSNKFLTNWAYSLIRGK